MYVFPTTKLADGRFGVIANGFDTTPDTTRRNKWGGGIVHPGVDVFYFRRKDEPQTPPDGTAKWYFPSDTVYALAIDGGTVRIAYIGTTGGVARVDHGGGILSDYIHLSSLLVKKDDKVVAGQALGLVGKNPDEGKDGLNHLHFQMWKGGLRDPAPWIRRAMHLDRPVDPVNVTAMIILTALTPMSFGFPGRRPQSAAPQVIDLLTEEQAGYVNAR